MVSGFVGILEGKKGKMMKKLSKQCILGFLAWMCPLAAGALDVRIVDSKGLIRAVSVVKDTSRVTIQALDHQGVSGECVAVNVDGIASERHEKISPSGECVFNALVAGTWQITVDTTSRWRAKIDG